MKRPVSIAEAYSRVRFYPSGKPFPTEIDASFPEMQYTTRRGEVKSAIHWGQRKLLLSEMQLMIEALETHGQTTRFVIVYAGSAPGTHLRFLDALFPGHRWILVDPIPFDTDALSSLPNFSLRNEYYTESLGWEMVDLRLTRAGLPACAALLRTCLHDLNVDVAANLEQREANLRDGVLSMTDATQHETLQVERCGLELLLRVGANRTPMLFVSDIRSGSVNEEGTEIGGPESEHTFRGVDFELHIAQDMRVQMQWVQQLQPTLALLKFRLPYMQVFHPVTKELLYTCPSPTTRYLRGRILLPIWTRPTSTECRLLVAEGADIVEYDNRKYENQCFYFNTVLREWTHFEHGVSCGDDKELCLDHRYDGTAEVLLLQRYFAITRSIVASPQDVIGLSQRISEALGKTFEQARKRLPKVLLSKAKQRGNIVQQLQLNERLEEHRLLDVWWEPQEVARQLVEGRVQPPMSSPPSEHHR